MGLKHRAETEGNQPPGRKAMDNKEGRKEGMKEARSPIQCMGKKEGRKQDAFLACVPFLSFAPYFPLSYVSFAYKSCMRSL